MGQLAPELAALITGSGVAGVFCALFITGLIFPKSAIEAKDKQLEQKDTEIAEWKHVAQVERTRADSLQVTAELAKDVFGRLRKELDG